MNFIKKYICELVFAINLFLIPFNHNFKIWWQRPIVNDAIGYYSYLPSLFLHHNLNYDSTDAAWRKHSGGLPESFDSKSAFLVKYKGQAVNKYPPGVAYFQAPFFFLAHFCAHVFNAEPDGFSDIYMYFMCIGAIFWQFVFFKLLRKIFLFYNLSSTALAITVSLLSFGTNLWFYTQIFGTYSHLYTLLSISLFFFAGLKFFDPSSNNKAKYFSWMLIGFSLALITRNINVIAILLLPCMGFKFKEIPNYLSVLKNKFSFLGILISILLLFSMFLFWKIQSGYWLVDSYPDEHFYWGKPQIIKSLFSPHKGWFFYTPLALVGLLGLFYAPKKIAVNFILLLALVIYITSSWWCWDYGTAFSMRAYIDWYLFVSIGLGFLIENLLHRRILLYSVVSVCVMFSAINLLQSVQFMRGILSGSSQGIEYTIKNFFRLRHILEYPISKNVTEASVLVMNNFNEAKEQPYAICNEQTPFSKGLQLNLSDYFKKEKYNHIRYGATVTLKDLNNPVLLCVSVTNQKDSLLFWHQIEINRNVLANKTEKVETGFNVIENIPQPIPPNSKIAVFFWQPKGNTECKIDDLYIEFVKAGVE